MTIRPMPSCPESNLRLNVGIGAFTVEESSNRLRLSDERKDVPSNGDGKQNSDGDHVNGDGFIFQMFPS